MNEYNPTGIRTPQDAVTAALDKWVTASRELGYEITGSHAAKSIDLLIEGGQVVTLRSPDASPMYANPTRRSDALGYSNNTMVTLSDGETKSALHINSDQMPYVLSTVGAEFVRPAFVGSELMRMVLDAEVVVPPVAE